MGELVRETKLPQDEEHYFGGKLSPLQVGAVVVLSAVAMTLTLGLFLLVVGAF